MTEAERDKFNDKLADFSRRLDAHIQDFKERGEFTDADRQLTEQLKRRRDQMQKRIAAAEANGTWDIIHSEMERDFSSLFDDWLQFNEQLDAEEMKGSQHTF